MKKLTSLLLASALVVAPIATSFAYQQTDKSDMPMMDGQMMQKMQTHMEEMRAVLDAVKSESDPEKREAMLHEHARNTPFSIPRCPKWPFPSRIKKGAKKSCKKSCSIIHDRREMGKGAAGVVRVPQLKLGDPVPRRAGLGDAEDAFWSLRNTQALLPPRHDA